MLHFPSCMPRAGGHSFLLTPLRYLDGGRILRYLSCAFLQEREKVAESGCDASWRDRGSRLPETHTPGMNTVLNTVGSRADSKVCSLQPAPSPCILRHLEQRSKGSPQRHTSKRSSQPILRPRIDFLSHDKAHALQNYVRVDWGELGPGWQSAFLLAYLQALKHRSGHA